MNILLHTCEILQKIEKVIILDPSSEICLLVDPLMGVETISYLVTWLPGYLVTWLPDYLVTCLPVYLVTWSPGFLVAWLPDKLVY